MAKIPPPVGVASSPTFLKRWGTIFLACAGIWVISVGTFTLVYYFRTKPILPNLDALTADHAREVLSLHKDVYEQWWVSLTSLFDLLVTKTVLPIITLLLGYLFGKKK